MRFTLLAFATVLSVALPVSSAPIPPTNVSETLDVSKGITSGVLGQLGVPDAPVYIDDAHDKRDPRVEDPELLHIIYSNAPLPVVGGTESGALQGPAYSGHSQDPADDVYGAQ
ncbi:hypothetical protein BDY19DRAFT_910457 [Irpex rosettiformis]|uniref:Uncharacterized protein n=1 Tax=Irpex rosettiformis TaxID=378272 RepID=A0ACB8TNP0_9APHY|nr:hypothetical protein BDY19DRAFT_910457 [Irpex rosettiformis]